MLRFKLSKTFVTILVLLLFFSFISFNFPLTGDDLNWGLVKLSRYFSSDQITNYDGRYLGNTSIIIASKYPLLRITAYAISSTLLVILSAKLINTKHWTNYAWPLFILLLTIPSSLFTQTFGWNSGFFNYVVGMLYPLYFAILLRDSSFAKQSINSFNYFIIAIGSILSCFFVEHVTLMNLLISIFSTYYIHKKPTEKGGWIYINLFGTLIGSFLMFSNLSYFNLLKNNNSQYRSTSLSFNSIYHIISEKIDFYVLINNKLLTTLLALLILYIATKRFFSSPLHFVRILSFIEILVSLLFWVFHYLVFNTFFQTFRYRYFISLILTFFFLAILSYEILYLAVTKQQFTLAYCLIGTFVLISPFLIVTPFGPRGAFGSTICLIILTICSYSIVINDFPQIFKPIILILTMMVIAFYGVLSSEIGYANRLKLDFINYQISNKKDSKKTLYLQVPYEVYYWSVHPQDDDPAYREFYHVRQLQGKLIPYNEWKSIMKNNSRQHGYHLLIEKFQVK